MTAVTVDQMITFENEVEIARPVAEVFSYVADLENIPTWNYAIETTSKVTPGPIGAGTEFRQRRTLPQPSEETVHIREHEPPERLVVEGRLGPFDARMTYLFAPASGGGTSLRNEVELRPIGAARLGARLAAGRVEEAVLHNLGVLKRTLEAG